MWAVKITDDDINKEQYIMAYPVTNLNESVIFALGLKKKNVGPKKVLMLPLGHQIL